MVKLCCAAKCLTIKAILCAAAFWFQRLLLGDFCVHLVRHFDYQKLSSLAAEMWYGVNYLRHAGGCQPVLGIRQQGDSDATGQGRAGQVMVWQGCKLINDV